MKLLAFDIETSGELDEFALQPWRVPQMRAWITTFAIALRDDQGIIRSKGWVMPYLRGERRTTQELFEQTKGRLAGVLQKAIDEGYTIVTWNGVFDIAFLLAYGLEELVFKCKWLDGMLLWKHLDSEPSWMGKRHYRLDDANGAFEKQYATYKKDVDYHTPSDAARDHLLGYNRKDNEATLLHCERFLPQLTPAQMVAVKIEASCLPIVADANLRGIPISEQNALKMDAVLRDIANTLAKKLAEHGCTEKDIRSPAKLRKLLFDRWGCPVIKFTTNAKTGEQTDTPSTDKEVLHELAVDDDRVTLLGQWREALNLRTKFVTSIRRSIAYNDEGNITHPLAVIQGTYTSRMTYSSKQGRGKANERQTGFALHQMKRDPRFRDSIEVPEDYLIVEADAAGQEFRWMAVLSGDETMLELCEEGGDPHSFLAAQIYGDDYETLKALQKSLDKLILKEAKNKRGLGKVGNLSLQYRTGKKRLRIVAKVQYAMPMTEELAFHTWKTYRKSYPRVPEYWTSQIEFGAANGYAETLAGRRLRVDGDWNGPHAYAMEQTMINYPIQGTGGEQKYLALAVLKTHLRRFDARMGWDLHDGIYFIVPRTKAEAFAHFLKATLDGLPYEKAWGFSSPIPLPWDVKIGRSWGSLVDLENWKEAA